MRRIQVVAAMALVGLAVAGLAVAGQGNNKSIHLSGALEVPVRDTNAQGQAIFRIADDGSSVQFKLIVANISNVTQAHIHCGSAGVNGPVVVWLYPGLAPPAGPSGQGRTNGVLSAGTFTEANVTTACAGVSSLEDVISLLQNGGAYVNVHTNDGVDPTNTGPGDFPGGEIRGDA